MMATINFCPLCDAPQHKLLMFSEEMFFCKDCNKFFNLKLIKFACWKCGSKRFKDSDFPSPDGQVVLQCSSCKKMFSQDDFFKKNEMVDQ
jgi:hypothetical protein